MNKRKLELKDMYEFKYCSEPQISPNGSNIVYTQTIVDKKSDGYITNLRISKNLEKPCDSISNASTPKWLKDSENIVFLRPVNGVKQLFIFNIETGEEKQITNLEFSVEFYNISPDNEKICFVMKKPNCKPPEKPEIKYINKLQVKDDGVKGFKDTNYDKHIYILNLNSNTVVQATPDDFVLEAAAWYTLSAPTWSNDSNKITFVSRVRDEQKRDYEPWLSDIYTIDINTLSLNTITKGDGIFLKPIWSKNDKEIISIGHFNEYYRSTDFSLYKINIETGDCVNLTNGLEATLEDYCNTDSALGNLLDTPIEDKNTNTVYFSVSSLGNTDLMKLDEDTKKITNLNNKKRRIYGFSVDKASELAAIAYSSVENPSRVSVIDLNTGEERLIADENKEILDEIELSIPEATEFMSRDFMKMEGWIMRAVECEEGKKYPTLLQIHGGPFTYYGNAFVFEFQLFAAQGYNVVYCNPRGTKGYGQSLATAVMDNYSTKDYDDIMRFVDHCVEKFDCIDKEQLSVTGGSYGGYMTNWIITQTGRFKFAISQRSISNWMTMYATSDLGYASIEQMKLGRKMRRIEELLEMSPIIYAQNVQTPLLLLHSEKDMRCPIEQAEQFFVALKHMKKDVRLIRFPESSHGLSRNGIPSLRTERLRNMVEFANEHTVKAE